MATGREAQAQAEAKAARLAALERLRGWITFREPNYVLIVANVVYVVTCLAILVIGYLTLYETKDDFNNNVAYKVKLDTPTPCGLPTPDMIHLFQSLNVYESGFAMPQLLEPNYDLWNRQVRGSLCSKQSWWKSDGNDGVVDNNDDATDATETTENGAREMHALSLLSGRIKYDPTKLYAETPPPPPPGGDIVLNQEAQFDADICATQLVDESDLYPQRLRKAYGDLKVRVARAYVAAAPAFYRYASRLAENTDQGCLGDRNPFLTGVCQNSDHVNTVLGRAGSPEALARMVSNEALSKLPDVREMLYALFALSAIGHVDRNTNGRCFKNDNSGTPYATAIEFCQSFITSGDLTGNAIIDSCGGHPTQTTGTFDDTSYYICKNHELSTLDCTSDTGVGPPPPPPAVDFERPINTLADSPSVGDAVIATCRNQLQYGLFDQTRLFGVPDIVEPFEVNARPDTWLNFLSSAVYNGLYINPSEAGVFKDPIYRLELFLGYRMWATTIWGMLIASVTGYFMARAVVPFVVQVLAIAIRLQSKEGNTVTLARPKPDLSLYFASLSCFLASAWTLYVDPSTQAPYPVSTECNDWIDNTLHTGSGAYLTSWGKRRFNRYSENQLGVALLFLAVLPFIYSFVSICIDPRIIRNRKKGRWLLQNTGAFWLVVGCAMGMQIAQAVQVYYSAAEWLVDVKLGSDTTDHNLETSRDCVAAVMIAFWSSASAGSARNRWAVGNIEGQLMSILWGGGTIGAMWLGIASYALILPDNFADALAYPTRDRDRQGTLIGLLVCAGVASALIGYMLYALIAVEPAATAPDSTIADQKENLRDNLNQAEAPKNVVTETFVDYQQQRSQNEEPELAPVRPFRFDLMKKPLAPPPTGERFSFRFADAQLGVGDETGYTTALPPAPLFDGRRRKDQVQYIPMLKFKH